MTENWSKTAVQFYDHESKLKISQKRRKVFVDAYAPISYRLKSSSSLNSSLHIPILDAGCGAGEMLSQLKLQDLLGVGIDISFQSLRQARTWDSDLMLVCGDLEHLPFKEGSIRALVSISTLEFCQNKKAVLQEFKRVLKESAPLYLEMRNKDFLLFTLFRGFLKPLERIGFIKTYPVSDFRDLTFSEWMTLFQNVKMKLEKVSPALWPWNFGDVMTRFKNWIIEITKKTTPVSKHYMIGFNLSIQNKM